MKNKKQSNLLAIRVCKLVNIFNPSANRLILSQWEKNIEMSQLLSRQSLKKKVIKNEINKKSISKTVLIILSGYITYKYGISSCVKIVEEEEIEKSIHNSMIKEEDSRISHIEKKHSSIFLNMLSYIRIMKMLFYISCTMFISLKS